MNRPAFVSSRILVCASLVLLLGGPQSAAEAVTAPTDKADAILSELRLIRQLLETAIRTQPPQQPPRPPVSARLKISDEFILGASDAPLTMVGYSDAQCPFCRKFHLEAFQEIKKNYIDTGKLRFIARDLPLEFHPNAMRAAEAARCAGEEGEFWSMRGTLITNPTALVEEDLFRYASSLGLDAARFRLCLRSGKYKAAIEKQLAEAASLEIGGTPSFVLGKTTSEGVDGVVVVGALPYEVFEAQFRSLLASLK